MPRSTHETSDHQPGPSLTLQSTLPNERELQAEQNQSTTVDPDSLATDANGLDIAAQQLEEECKYFNAKRKSSPVTSRLSEASRARETQRLQELANEEARLQNRAVRLYEVTKGIYMDEYDMVARCFAQRIRYYRYGIHVAKDEALSETLYDIPAIRRDHFEGDKKRRVMIAKYRLEQLELLSADLENRRTDLKKDRQKPHALEDRALLANGYNRVQINIATERLTNFEDKVREFKFLAERLRVEAGENVISNDDVHWSRKTYRSIVDLFIEAGLPVEDPGKYKPFEEAYFDKSNCAVM